jgi:uncharacterized RmlC-like cupin family protein
MSITSPPLRMPPLDADLLLAIAQGLGRATGLWEGRLRHDGPGRHAVRLLAQEAYEVWVIAWPAGHRTTAHDHGGSAAAIAVVEGELVEIRTGPHGAERHPLPAGAAIAVPADAVHDVRNETTGPTTSVHVYSPPLSTMTFYDVNGSADAVLLVEEEPPIVDARQLALAVHPTAAARGHEVA